MLAAADVELKAETARIKRNIQVLISRETSGARTEIMFILVTLIKIKTAA